MRHKVEFTIDGAKLFDTTQKVGQQAAGERLLATFLQASTGALLIRDHLALSIYGIQAGGVSAVSGDGSDQEEHF